MPVQGPTYTSAALVGGLGGTAPQVSYRSPASATASAWRLTGFSQRG